MIKDLIKIAQKLDSIGMKKEADAIDSIIRKVASRRENIAFADIESNKMQRHEPIPEHIDFGTTTYHTGFAGSEEPRRFEGSIYEESARNEFRRLKNKFPNLAKKVNPDHFVQEYCAMRESRYIMRPHIGNRKEDPYDYGEGLLMNMISGNTWGKSMP